VVRTSYKSRYSASALVSSVSNEMIAMIQKPLVLAPTLCTYDRRSVAICAAANPDKNQPRLPYFELCPSTSG